MNRATARLVVVLLATLASLALAGPASAHVGGGMAGSDFDGRVTSVTPHLPGVTVRVLQFGDDLELVNRSSSEVEVPGYDDEPYLRIGPDGKYQAIFSSTALTPRRRAVVPLLCSCQAGMEFPIFEPCSTAIAISAII